MEKVHGVDVSWLHHSARDPHYRSQASVSPSLTRDAPFRTTSYEGTPEPAAGVRATSKASGTASTASAPLSPAPSAPVIPKQPRRPTVLGRATSDKAHLPTLQTPSSPTLSRRGSWISSISSKFSSSKASPQPSVSAVSSTPPATKGGPDFVNPFDASSFKTPLVSVQQEPVENLQPYVPLPPKGTNSSFFSNVARRFSTSGSQITGAGKADANGGMAPRRVMNIDVNRQRCPIEELHPSKLRRVSFCVDVEITSGPKYEDEEDTLQKKKKVKERKLKERGEGAALKNPEAVRAQKESSGVIEASGEKVGTSDAADLEERHAEAELGRQGADEKGNKSTEAGPGDDTISRSNPAGTSTTRPQHKPTTDPLRIYRRCCQLRETPILKRISDQLQNPLNLTDTTPGVVNKLDLSGSRMMLTDIVTLGDWLAIVPVRRLLLEDAELTDEGVRIILAGLLAAKIPEPTRSRKRSPSNGQERNKERGNSSIIEKVTLRNNPRIAREGWRHISLFIYMSNSLKAVDVSMIPFPVLVQSPNTLSTPGSKPNTKQSSSDMAEIMFKAISERPAGARLEELTIAECGLDAEQLRKIIDAVQICGVKRLSVAKNGIDDTGFAHVLRYLRSGVCQGIDLGGNDLRNKTAGIADAVRAYPGNQLLALSLAGCNLEPSSLDPLLPALVSLPNLRFLDLSHNHDLFSTNPSALGLLRKYIPRFPALKRIHLADVSLSTRQAIGLIEVLPENQNLAHLNILENPELSELASARDEARQEEACALYASLMAAVRVSRSIICVDIDVPSHDSSEIVKAMAKQVVAYCLRNMENFTATQASESAEAIAAVSEPYGGEKEVTVPDVLLHMVGHDDNMNGSHDADAPAPDEDYIVGGTGVVKALSYCLGEKASDLRRASVPASGNGTPNHLVQESEVGKSKAKEVSKNLLMSARNIRARLQPAILREAKGGDEMAYRRLLFLDETLQGIIQRFEDEYPECRLAPASESQGIRTRLQRAGSKASIISATSILTADADAATSDADESGITDSMILSNGSSGEHVSSRPVLNHTHRHGSEVFEASRALAAEEGEMHRFGQTIRREILKPQTLDHAHGTTGDEVEPEHIQVLRAKLAEIPGEHIRDKVAKEGGWEAVVQDIGAQAAVLKDMMKINPAEFERLAQSLTQGRGENGNGIHENRRWA